MYRALAALALVLMMGDEMRKGFTNRTGAENDSPIPAERARKAKRITLRWFVILFGTYAVTCMFVNLFQSKLIYFPTRGAYRTTPADVGLPFESVNLTTKDGVEIAGWFVGREGGTGTILYCHGNAGDISDRIGALKLMHGLGFEVFLIDYRGFGMSQGNPTEQGTYLDAEAAWSHLVEVRGVVPSRIVLFGESLGGAVAVELATRHSPAALVVQATFTSLVDVGRQHYPLLPVDWLLRFRYDSLSKIGRVVCPKLFIHSTDDELVPIVLARRLFEAAAEPKQFLETPGGHNTGGFDYNAKTTSRFREFMEHSVFVP